MGLSTVLFLSLTCSMVLCRVIPPAIPVCICTLEFSPVCGLDKVTTATDARLAVLRLRSSVRENALALTQVGGGGIKE